MVEGAANCRDACLRFRAIGATAVARRVRWAPDEGPDAAQPSWYGVAGRENEVEGCPARMVRVEDSSSGVAVLVWGGGHGLWLTREGGRGGVGYAEPYLLLSCEAVEALSDDR